MEEGFGRYVKGRNGTVYEVPEGHAVYHGAQRLVVTTGKPVVRGHSLFCTAIDFEQFVEQVALAKSELVAEKRRPNRRARLAAKAIKRRTL